MSEVSEVSGSSGDDYGFSPENNEGFFMGKLFTQIHYPLMGAALFYLFKRTFPEHPPQPHIPEFQGAFASAHPPFQRPPRAPIPSPDSSRREPLPLPSQGVPDFFQALVLDKKSEAAIRFLVTSLANDSMTDLLKKKNELEAAGKNITAHPLKFLEFILQDPALQKDLKTLSQSWFKSIQWRELVKGISSSLERANNRGDLFQYVAGFARQVGKNPSEIDKCLKQAQWEKCVSFLVTASK